MMLNVQQIKLCMLPTSQSLSYWWKNGTTATAEIPMLLKTESLHHIIIISDNYE